MCTAATYKTKDFYFGRTLDYEFSYGDEVTITPRNFQLNFRKEKSINSHYAMIGMAHVIENYPLYYDAVNEKGLGMAGLNFVGNAVYRDKVEGKDNISQFEFIPWILGNFENTNDVKKAFENVEIVGKTINPQVALATLHWIVSDKNGETIVIEKTKINC